MFATGTDACGAEPGLRGDGSSRASYAQSTTFSSKVESLPSPSFHTSLVTAVACPLLPVVGRGVRDSPRVSATRISSLGEVDLEAKLSWELPVPGREQGRRRRDENDAKKE
jgi:hypothetical protein